MICGSCGMRMDGAAVLACKTRMYDIAEAGHVPVISPMGNLPIVKDLVVDMEPFWAKFRAVNPYLQPGYNVPPAGREHRISQQRMNVIQKESLCINCGCCVSECNAMDSSPEFLGPQALAKAMRFVGDPRDGAKNARLDAVNGEHGDLGVHALLLLQRALPEGRRPARRDREARRRVDQGGDRPRHGREAREVVRHLGEDDRLAARDRARAEDAGRSSRPIKQTKFALGLAQGRQGADAVPAARREGRARVAAPARPPLRAGSSRVRGDRPGRGCAGEARARPSRGRTRPVRARFVPEAVHQGGEKALREAGRLLQGLPRLSVGEGARLLDAGARSPGRSRADRARVGDLLRRRRHPGGRARLLPAPERTHPGVRGRHRLRHAADGLQRLHAQPAAGQLPADRRRRASRIA